MRVLLALTFAVVACRADIPEGKLACARDADCPGGWQCLPGPNGLRCYSEAEGQGDGGGGAGEGGSGRDGGGTDGGDGGGAGDGGDDPCAVDHGGCDDLVTCTGDDGAARCGACPTGYDDVEGDGTRCADIDECATDNGGCGAANAFLCVDREGASPTCSDIDECAADNGGCEQLCTNADGSYACGCNPGSSIEADARTCHLPVWGMPQLLEHDDVGPALLPVTGVDDSGNVIAVWYKQTGGYKVWASRYDASARAWDPEEQIQAAGAANGYLPHIAVDAAGNAFAVWEQTSTSETNRVIFSARYVAGDGWQPPEPVESLASPNDSHEARVAIDGAGNAAAVWYQSTGSPSRSDVWGNRYTAGSGWGTPALLETDNVGNASYQDVAMDASGNAIAVWAQSDGTRYNLWASHSAPGGAWSAPERVDDDDMLAAWSPSIAFDAAGNALVVWFQSDANVWSNRFVPGAGWSGAVPVEEEAGSGIEPRVAVNASGNAIAVWTHIEPGGERSAWANQFTVDGGWEQAAPLETDTGDASLPDVSINAAGDAMTVWDQSDGMRRNIWSNRYIAGHGWLGASRVEEIDTGDALAPRVVIDASGHATATWDLYGAERDVWTGRFE